jgi:hypothetical protein
MTDMSGASSLKTAGVVIAGSWNPTLLNFRETYKKEYQLRTFYRFLGLENIRIIGAVWTKSAE